MSSWSKDSFPPFDWPEGTYFYCPLTYSVSHYIQAFIQDLPVNACNSFFPVLPYCFPCPQKMPNTGVVIRSILFLQTLWFLHFCLRLTILPHSSMPSDPRHTVFLWCLYAPFDTTDPPLPHGKIQASVSASFLLTHFFVRWRSDSGFWQIVRNTEMQLVPPGRCSIQGL